MHGQQNIKISELSFMQMKWKAVFVESLEMLKEVN